MAHLLRGKQAGIQNDLSLGLTPDLFNVDDLLRYGINSQICALAYDPVQSLLALGTRHSQFGPAQVYVFGRNRIQAVFPIPARGGNISTLQFCADKLVCLDSKHDISIYSLELKSVLATYSPPGQVSILCTDPMLDYALLGMATGEIVAFDMDRETMAPFKIPNLWKEIEPRAKMSTIISLQFHPRDIGTLLIGYMHGAVIYSFKQAKSVRHFVYEVPRGAPGGDGDPAGLNVIRRPRLSQAVWHPTGTFIMTGYEDSSIVFWDTLKDGRILMARTLTDTNVATPGAVTAELGQGPGTMAVKEPLFKLAWCANLDPEDTAILIAGGQSTQSPTKGLTLFEMGRTPLYSTATWDVLVKYFDQPKRQRILPTPPGAEVVNFCLIPRTSPHFAGAHDPIAVIALLSSGELLTLSFPSGMPISPTNQLHPSVSFVHPFIKRIAVAQADRERWLGLAERRNQGPLICKGGAETPRPMRRHESRNIVQTVHADGTIRLWDIGHNDELENDKVVQVDVARAVGHFGNVEVTATSFSAPSAELVVGLHSGEVVIYKWGVNRHAGREPPAAGPNRPGALTSVIDRVEPSLSEGLVPLTLLDQQDGPVTAVRMSEVGFVAAGFEGGSIAIIDLRGPAIIYSASIADLSKERQKGSLRRRASSGAAGKPEWATQLEFSVMQLESEDYSSFILHAGTNLGHLASFKILPDPSGRYTVQFAGSVSLDNRIMTISPINADTGAPTRASQQAVGGLRSGIRVSGVLVAVTPTSIHVFRPPTSKGAHKSFDSFFCDTASVVRYLDQGYAIVGLFGDGNARAYSIPSLKEIATIKLSQILDVRRFADAVITPTGHILGFTGPSEMALVSIFGVGAPLKLNDYDKLFNPEALIPPRPTISNLQWVTGTQYITPADMDILIGGPNRPPSKRMLAQSRAEEIQRKQMERNAAAAGGAGSAYAAAAQANLGQADETYWAYMQRQIQERTEKLGIMSDSMSNLEESSSNWANDVSKFVNKQKRNAAGSIIKAKFGF